MKGLQFQRLVLVSDSKKVANQFEFPKRFNLVTGSDNSVGKSTLVKNIFWSIGCDPDFDLDWKSNNVKSILYFKVNGNEYIVSRHSDGIYFGRTGQSLTKYSKITGDYAKDFAKEVGFKVKLANKQDGLDCPPPAFYFLPFYIDQKKSWNMPWAGFNSLSQYNANAIKVLIKYWCGYLSIQHFDFEEKVLQQKELESAANTQINRFTDAINVLVETAPQRSIALNSTELEKIQVEIESELKEFSLLQSSLFEKQADLASEIYDLEQQHLLASSSARELNADYTFAVENIPSDTLECPLCGVEHDNSLLSRAGLLANKDELEKEAASIESLLNIKYLERLDLAADLSAVASEICRINQKYLNDEQPTTPSENDEVLNQALFAISQHKVQNSVDTQKQNYQLQSQQAIGEQAALKKAQRKLIVKSNINALNDLFLESLTQSVSALGATGVNLDGVKSPMEYKKLLGGGAAEGTRGTLAYHLAVLKQIEHVGNSQVAPFVIDTPNQQEQAEHRYETVIKVIKSKIPDSYQVILCAMESEALAPYIADAHIIELNENRLLQREYYSALSAEYEQVVLNSQ